MWRVLPMPWIIHSAALFGFGLGCLSNSSWGWFDVELFKVIQHPALVWLRWVQELAGALCCIGPFTTAAKPINLFQRCNAENCCSFYFYDSVFCFISHSDPRLRSVPFPCLGCLNNSLRAEVTTFSNQGNMPIYDCLWANLNWPAAFPAFSFRAPFNWWADCRFLTFKLKY